MDTLIQDIKLVLEYPHSCLIASIIFLFLSLNPKNLYKAWILHQTLERGDPLPDRIANFPIHQTSVEDYLNSKEKIDLFINQASKGSICQLELSADDINNLYLRGQTLNKYSTNNNIYTSPVIFKYTNDYYYFQIVDNRLLHRTIKYIRLLGSVDGIQTETRETRFITYNESIMTKHKVIEFNGKRMDSDSDWSDDKFFSLRSNDDFLVTSQ